jgi:leader peptidase (prepilin peptidase)/N-methyltransferase
LGVLLSPFQDPDLFRDNKVAAVLSPENAERLLPWVGSILGALASAGALLVVASLYRAVRKKQGLGLGDVKMLALIGAFLGWRLALLTIFVGSFLGSILGIFLIILKGRTLQTKLPFGTFLGAAAAIVLFFGLPFWTWYTSAP